MKMERYGMGGNLLRIIQSIYYNDQVIFQVNGEQCKPLYLKRGVKQGCNLSPVLFNLYMADLSHKLNTEEKQVKLGNTSINHLIFADDLILITDGPQKEMNHLIKVTSEYCDNWKLEIAPTKTKILKYGGQKGVWIIPNIQCVP